MSASRSSAPAGARLHADHRSPYVLDIHTLGRRAGSMATLRRDVPAPADWALDIVGVPAGSPVALQLRVESVMDGVLVTGTADVQLDAECGRCLDQVQLATTVEFQELFAYAAEPGDEDTPLVDGDFIDLEPVLRDAIVLALPINPLCAEDCAGLCPGCGEKYAALPADHSHDQIDPRWAALRALRTDGENSKES